MFLKVKPKPLTWYAYDVTILSRTVLEFVAYDMADPVFGGIGSVVWCGKVSVPASVTHKDVDRAILRAARARREEEIAAAEAAIVSRYADSIRAELDATA